MFRFLALGSVAFAMACGGSDPAPDAAKTIDAPGTADAPHTGSGSGSAAFGAACTVPTDTGSDCTGSTECESGCCTTSFNQSGPVCSVQCTMKNDGSDTAECPAGSQGNKCNMKGFCKP